MNLFLVTVKKREKERANSSLISDHISTFFRRHALDDQHHLIHWSALPLLYAGRVHLSFERCLVYFVTFILLLMENPVRW